jgi:hypothetical protein
MSQPKTSTHDSDSAWVVGVPKCQEFTQPQFHSSDRVKWTQETDGRRVYRTGRILGMTFTLAQQWQYKIHLDLESSLPSQEDYEVTIPEAALTLVPDSQSICPQLRTELDWRLTQVAPQSLGVSAKQLRKLRRRGLFKSGYHDGYGLDLWILSPQCLLKVGFTNLIHRSRPRPTPRPLSLTKNNLDRTLTL